MWDVNRTKMSDSLLGPCRQAVLGCSAHVHPDFAPYMCSWSARKRNYLHGMIPVLSVTFRWWVVQAIAMCLLALVVSADGPALLWGRSVVYTVTVLCLVISLVS